MSSPSPSNSPLVPPPPTNSSDSPPPQRTSPPLPAPLPSQLPPDTVDTPAPSTMASPPPPPLPPQSPPSPPPVSPPPTESPPSPPPPVPTPPTPTTPPPQTPPTSPPPTPPAVPPTSPPPEPPVSPPPVPVSPPPPPTPEGSPPPSPPPRTPEGSPPPSPPPRTPPGSPPRTPPGSPPRTPPPASPPSPPPPPQPPNRSPSPPPRTPRSPPPPPPANTPEPSPPPPPPVVAPPPDSSTTPIVPPPSSISTTPPTMLFPSPPPPPSIAPPLFSPPPPRSDNNTTVLVVSFLGLALFLGFLGIMFCWWKRKRKASGHGHVIPTSVTSNDSDSTLLKVQISGINNGSLGSHNGYSPREGGMGNSRSWFTYDDLLEATSGFTANNLLGEGGFGSVYKGYLVDGRVVAVKQLKIGGGQGEREFRAEVEIIGRIHHRHLVSLIGYCISEEKRLLVYEYVPNNTLYFHLHGQGRPVMDWATRVKIAMGAARGINYLHEDCHPRVIHRDIKSSNILLDNNFEAKVADFGLAKLAEDANTHVTTRVMGTFGYMAPEYASSGKLTEKSDVYSFGVVLLELISGRKPVDTSQPLGEESLVEWARPLLNDAIESEEFETLADPRLEGNFVDVEMFRMIQAAAACVRHSSSKRPRMGQVVRAFDSVVTSDLTNGMRVGESEIFNSAQQSAEIRLFQRMAFGSHEYSTDFFSQSSLDSERNKVNSRSQSRKD